jgi:hypothetical protein
MDAGCWLVPAFSSLILFRTYIYIVYMIFHYKSSILRYLHLWKPIYIYMSCFHAFASLIQLSFGRKNNLQLHWTVENFGLEVTRPGGWTEATTASVHSTRCVVYNKLVVVQRSMVNVSQNYIIELCLDIQSIYLSFSISSLSWEIQKVPLAIASQDLSNDLGLHIFYPGWTIVENQTLPNKVGA